MSVDLPSGCASAQEIELVQLVNEYRSNNGLGLVTPARWLSTTAQWHLWDRVHNPDAVGGGCSSHSWSNNPPTGMYWSPVCWTGSQSVEMWRKPFEISAGVYVGNGFELTADAGGSQTAAQALFQWQHSPAHNTVILQQGAWSGIVFTGVGVAISGPYAAMWFGDGSGNGGTPSPCELLANGFE